MKLVGQLSRPLQLRDAGCKLRIIALDGVGCGDAHVSIVTWPVIPPA